MLSTVPPPGGVLCEVPLRSITSRASNNDFAGCCHPDQTRLPRGGGRAATTAEMFVVARKQVQAASTSSCHASGRSRRRFGVRPAKEPSAAGRVPLMLLVHCGISTSRPRTVACASYGGVLAARSQSLPLAFQTVALRWAGRRCCSTGGCGKAGVPPSVVATRRTHDEQAPARDPPGDLFCAAGRRSLDELTVLPA
jgi:hypothetical protein